MNITLYKNSGFIKQFLVLIAALAVACVASARDKLPETTPDGLRLVKQDKVAAVYLKPGATFGGYDKVAILNCFVAFKKNWQQEQNEEVPLSVSDADVKRLKEQIASQFKQVFAAELTKDGETVVTYGASDVLVLRPAIINLSIEAPDTMDPTTVDETVIGPSGGQMTLYLELYDSVTDDLLARVLDPEPIDGSGTWMVRNEVTNKADADLVMKRWADLLGKYLQHARAATSDKK